MTQSIIHYYPNDPSHKVNVELTLGKDTCKMASCIPCSIFMWSNGTPATATHFGRGGNWNFPLKIFRQIQKYSAPEDLTTLPVYTQNWINKVWSAYEAGSTCFKKPDLPISNNLAFALQFSRKETPQMFEKIPQMFL